MLGLKPEGGCQGKVIANKFCIVNDPNIVNIYQHLQFYRLVCVGMLLWNANYNLKKCNGVLIFFRLNSQPEFHISYLGYKTPSGEKKKKVQQNKTALIFPSSNGFYALGQDKGCVTRCQIARRLKESTLLRTCIMMTLRTLKEFVPHVCIRVC